MGREHDNTIPFPGDGEAPKNVEITVRTELIRTRLINIAAGMLVTDRLVEFGEIDKDLGSKVHSARNRLMRILPDNEARLEAVGLADENWSQLINEANEAGLDEQADVLQLDLVEGIRRAKEGETRELGEEK